MDIVQIVTVGIISVVLAVTVKKQSPEISILISIAAGVLIFLMVIPRLSALIGVFGAIERAADYDLEYLPIILKIIGIAYIAQFGSQICGDAGESVIASKVELGGKLLIMVVSAPVIVSLIDMIVTMLP